MDKIATGITSCEDLRDAVKVNMSSQLECVAKDSCPFDYNLEYCPYVPLSKLLEDIGNITDGKDTHS